MVMTDRYSDIPSTRNDVGRTPRRGDFIGAITDAASRNPVPAALIGLGALWLFMGGRNMTLLGGPGRTSVIGVAGHGVGSAASGAVHAAERAGSAVSSGVSAAASGLADTVSSASDYVRGAVHGVDAQSAYRNADLSGEGNGEPLGASRSRYRTTSASALRENMTRLFDDHPLALGIAGIALGMGVAASLPLTRQEQETLGTARDKVEEKLSEAAEQAKGLASSAVEEAKQQLRSG